MSSEIISPVSSNGQYGTYGSCDSYGSTGPIILSCRLNPTGPPTYEPVYIPKRTCKVCIWILNSLQKILDLLKSKLNI